MNRVLTLLALVTFSGALFTRSTDPIVPQIAVGLNVEPATAALLSTAFALPYAIVQPVLGALADMFNKARLMLICLAILAAVSVVCAFAPNFEVLVVGRMIAGIVSGGLVPIALAFVGDLVPINQRQVAIGRILFAVMSGNLVGSFGSGALADLFGWRSVFVGMIVIAVVTLAIAVPGLRGAAKGGGRFDLSTLGPNYRAIFSNPLAKICFGAVLLEGAFMYGIFPHVATLLHAAGETRASIAGVVIAGFGIGGAVYTFFVGWFLTRLGEQRMMLIGGCGLGLTLAIIALRSPWPVEFINFFAMGLAFYLIHGVIQIYASEIAPAARGSALALHSFFFFLGQAVGPAIYGAAFAVSGPTPILMFGAVVLAMVGVVCARWLRRPPITV